jgi:formamidopyrimidine-DNA glycosylase
MPELPEVETVVTTLRPKVVGKPILAVVSVRQDILTPAELDLSRCLCGRTIRGVERRGKRIVCTLDDGNRFYIHLGMTGQVSVVAPDTPLPPHTHLELDLGVTRMRFRDPRRFGGLWWLGQDAPDEKMGPEPLELRPKELLSRLGRTTRAVKNALLDQRVVAGLGNIYVDEALHGAGIHPLTPANRLSMKQVGRLSRAIKSTLRRAIRHRGSTLRDYLDADGAAGGFQRLHRVYDREGEPCPRCRAAIKRIMLGGRSTHFCPGCQPVQARFGKPRVRKRGFSNRG